MTIYSIDILFFLFGEGSYRGWNGWIASPTWWTWVWVSSGSWWRTGKPAVMRSVGLQRVRHDWVTELTDFLTNMAPFSSWYIFSVSIINRDISIQKVKSKKQTPNHRHSLPNILKWQAKEQAKRNQFKSNCQFPINMYFVRLDPETFRAKACECLCWFWWQCQNKQKWSHVHGDLSEVISHW